MKEAQETRKRLSHSSLDMRLNNSVPLDIETPRRGKEGRKATNEWMGRTSAERLQAPRRFHCVGDFVRCPLVRS